MSGGSSGGGNDGAPGQMDDPETGGRLGTMDAASGPDAPSPNEGGASSMLACNADPPMGAKEAPPFPTYAGTCPKLVAAAPAAEGGTPIPNTITSSGNQRQFLLAVPSNLQPNEKLPVIFMWHWLGGSDTDFYNTGEVQQAVDQQRFLAVMPQAKGDIAWEWPFAVSDSDARMAEEFQYFDDMLACVAAQFPTANKNCVASAGVSAGALFTDQLGSARANRLSSIESLSGGVGGLARGWGSPAHALPALILWGGPDDMCGLAFQTESQNLEAAMKPADDFIVECIHNCGHSVPPVVPVQGQSTFASLWSFMFDHPFWLSAGQSPYTSTGLPSDYPTWCAIGAGKATIRTGSCNSSPACSTP
jgi:poly(3-hydroxybutyrate) depolymerase